MGLMRLFSRSEKVDLGSLLEQVSEKALPDTVKRISENHTVPGQYTKKAIDIARKNGDVYVAAQIHMNTGNPKHAVVLLRRAGQLFEAYQLAKDAGWDSVLNRLADEAILSAFEDRHEILQIYTKGLIERGIELARENDCIDKILISAGLAFLDNPTLEAELRSETEQHKKAAELYKKAEMPERAVIEYRRDISFLDNELHKARSQNLVEAIKELESAREKTSYRLLHLAQDEAYTREEADARIMLKQFYEAAQTLEDLEQTERVDNEINALYKIGTVHYLNKNDFLNLARCEQALSRFDEADESYARAINAVIDNQTKKSDTDYVIGNIASEAKAHDIAMHNFADSIRYGEALRQAEKLREQVPQIAQKHQVNPDEVMKHFEVDEKLKLYKKLEKLCEQ